MAWILFLPLCLPAQLVISGRVDGVINPVAAGYIHRCIRKAVTEKAECLIIHLNTPGGLLESTRLIVSDILSSPVPVVVYVSPAGAHAGSAGVFITLAADLAAMAPGTNLGAAHPVSLQGEQDSIMSSKATNDAAAFIRTITAHRHRNGQWAESAVRSSLSLTEAEAMSEHVIDLVADNTADLLRKIDGKTVTTAAGEQVLHTRSARVEEVPMGFNEKLLDLISNPNLTYILLLLGLYGLLFELYNPGSILPGIVGFIALILAFYAMQTLPVNYAGLALILFAIILFVLDLKLASHGILAIGGIVSLLLGSVMLIRPGQDQEFLRISRLVIVFATGITALFFLTVIGLGIRAQRGRPVTGPDSMMGATGVSVEALAPLGRVLVQGEYWQAESTAGNIAAGERVKVTGIRQLKLFVERLTT